MRNRRRAMLLLAVSYFWLLLPAAKSLAATVIERVTYLEMPSYRLSDGVTEAIAVPQIGRIMRFGKVGGANVLWNAADRHWKPGEYANYGGEKTWLSPQSSWAEFYGSDMWPPDPALDGSPYQASVVAPGVLELRSHVSPGTGISIVKRLSFAANGDLVITVTASKQAGPPLRIGLWSDTQVVPAAMVFLPVSPKSGYKKGYSNLIGRGAVADVWPDMIRVVPGVKTRFKVGVDSDAAAIVSIYRGVAFVEATRKLPGNYPDGPDPAGAPVEFYMNNDPANYYCELEMLGPLVHARAGSAWGMTLHWSLHDVPSSDGHAKGAAEAARRLLYANDFRRTE